MFFKKKPENNTMLNFNEDKHNQLLMYVKIMKNESRSDNFFVLFSPFYDNFINMPVPYFSFKLSQIKFKKINDQV